MKLLIVTSLNEYQQIVAEIFEKADVRIFSTTGTTGYRANHPDNILDNWFSYGQESFDSVFIFSFTPDDNASGVLSLVKKYNDENPGDYPIRAFVVPVEAFV